MSSYRLIALCVAYLCCASSAFAAPIIYVTNLAQQFGTIDVGTGAFTPVGASLPEGVLGLGVLPNGSLATLTYSGNLDVIDPVTGTASLVGPTGLADCTTPASPCGPTAANRLGALAGNVYVSDLQNDLYGVDLATGGATLVGSTGLPGIPFTPGSVNADGTVNLYDQAIFGVAGKLYASVDAFVFDFATFSVTNVLVAPTLYELDPATGVAMLIGPTDLGIGAIAAVGGVAYGFNNLTGQLVTVDLSTGKTSFVTNLDPTAGVIEGAAAIGQPVPEPAMWLLFGLALSGTGVRHWGRARLRTR